MVRLREKLIYMLLNRNIMNYKPKKNSRILQFLKKLRPKPRKRCVNKDLMAI